MADATKGVSGIRRIELTQQLEGGWERWIMLIPPELNPPAEITRDWVESNIGALEYFDLIETGFDMAEIVDVEEVT